MTLTRLGKLITIRSHYSRFRTDGTRNTRFLTVCRWGTDKYLPWMEMTADKPAKVTVIGVTVTSDSHVLGHDGTGQ